MDRRKFLKTTGIIAAGLAFLGIMPKVPKAAELHNEVEDMARFLNTQVFPAYLKSRKFHGVSPTELCAGRPLAEEIIKFIKERCTHDRLDFERNGQPAVFGMIITPDDYMGDREWAVVDPPPMGAGLRNEAMETNMYVRRHYTYEGDAIGWVRTRENGVKEYWPDGGTKWTTV